ncbi:MAG: AsmA-like C-terminal region, partial [Lacunisphaera sp.]|nr:AsmA-like C-terminal region [Lacunisphaera sp.]
MKPARLLLVLLGVLALAGVAGAVLALKPSVQRSLLLRIAAKQPGLKLEVESVSAGFSHVALRGVTASKRGLTLKVGQLDADYSLWALLFSRRLEIHRLSASGLMINGGRISPVGAQAAAAGAPAAAAGLLGGLQLPVSLVLDEVELAGRTFLPGIPGGASLETEFKITGGKFAPGQEGSLLLITEVKTAVGVRVTTLNIRAGLRATQTAQRTFNRVALSAVVDATGQNLSDQSQLKLSAELARDATGENYSVSVDTLLRGAPGNVIAVHASLPAGGREYAGDWTLKARTAQLEPFFLGGALPEFNAHGEGRFTFAPATGAMSLQGKLDADASRLELLQPALRAVGAVKLSAEFDVAEAGGVAQLHQLEVRLAGDQPVLELHAAQAAELNFREKRLQVGPAGAVGEVLNLNLTGLPLAWVRPFVRGLDISGGTITGRLAVTADRDRLTARATTPLRVGALSIVQRGQLVLNKADLSLAADAVLTPQNLQVRIGELTLKTPAGDSFTAQATVSIPVSPDPAISVEATCDFDLPKLLAPWLPLGRVKATGEADFTASRAKLEVRRFLTDITDGTGAALLKAAALRPFAFDLATRRATTAENAAADLLRLTLGRLPLDHLPLNTPGAKLGGVVEAGEFMVAADGDKLTVRALSSLKLAEVSLAQAGRPALADLRIEAQP